MKKMFFLLSIAALVFTSCSNDEQTVETQVQKVPDGAIYFSSGIQDLTRATTTMSTFNAFKVTGIYADNSQSFFNLPVNRSGSLWTYAATEDDYKYWPSDNSDVNFFAYAPTTLAGVDVSSVQQVVENFEQVQHVANQVDVLAAAATGNKTNNASTGMALDFKHALAQIEVRAKNSLTDKYKVEVLGVKLCRIGNKGNMTFQTAATDYPVWALDAESASQSFIKKGTDAIEMTSSVKNIMFGDDNFLLIPQQLKAWTGSDTDVTGAYLSVLCKISQKNEAGDWVTIFPAETNDKTGLYAFTSVPISTKWEVGHKYVYTLDFFGAGGGAGQADPEPVNPEAGDTPDPDVDPNPGTLTDPEKPKDPEEITDPGAGDPVVSDPTLKSVLKFTVSITDWVNGEGDNEKLDL
jgi:hypothetical protein